MKWGMSLVLVATFVAPVVSADFVMLSQVAHTIRQAIEMFGAAGM